MIEYKIIKDLESLGNGSVVEVLNTLTYEAKQGWELITILQRPMSKDWIFKRETHDRF